MTRAWIRPRERRFTCWVQVAAAALVCVLVAGCGKGVGVAAPALQAAAPVPNAPAGPVLGFVWTAADQTLRPLLGVVGSSVVGASVVPAGLYVAGAASSASDLGVVEDASHTLYAVALPAATATRLAAGAPEHAQIAMSPQGGVAIAYAPGGDHVMVLANLAGTPKATTLAMPAGSTVKAAAVSDAGTVLVETGTSPVTVGVLSAEGAVARVSTVTQAGGMGFLPATEDAVVADGGSSTLALLHSVSGISKVQSVSAAGLNGPVALAVSRDARWAVVANGGDARVVSVDLVNGGGVVVDCGCRPSGVYALTGGNSFRLNEMGNGPMWILDVGGAAPRMFFVPAVR